MKNTSTTEPVALYQGIHDVLLAARTQVRQTVNTTMVQTYWQIGRLIVENEQGGSARAAYGKGLLKVVSQRLSVEFGKGFSHTNLKLFRQFYLTFPISHTLCDQSGLASLSWSHFRHLLRVDDAKARTWYTNEAIAQGWSVRALDRQINTLFYERLLGSQDKAGVQAEAVTLIARDAATDSRDFIRDPYVLEFWARSPMPVCTSKTWNKACSTSCKNF